MSKRKTQYQPSEYLRKLADEQAKDFDRWSHRFNRWKKFFDELDPLPQEAISDVLARHGYEPDHQGVPSPRESWPPREKPWDCFVVIDNIVDLTLEERTPCYVSVTEDYFHGYGTSSSNQAIEFVASKP